MHFLNLEAKGPPRQAGFKKAPLSMVHTTLLRGPSLCPRSVLPNGDNVAVVLRLWILARPLVFDKLHRSFEEDFVCRWFEVES